ncbi:MAG: type II toxin-antitoxin system HicB family antitoxin [Spirochaetaceae bacterium]|jgi:predicted RNase H-like HicB family nuclease|nr:type II toxin-antitoxin system HicB family antitoxin [Spirochaetaceae bacterium]
MKTTAKEIKPYLEMPYNIIIQHIVDEGGNYYYATVLEFDGCMSDGTTYQEAFENIQDAMKGWIETKIENGFPVPPPIIKEKYSGKFIVRLPKTLHARLAIEAEKEGVSLHQYALYKLSV